MFHVKGKLCSKCQRERQERVFCLDGRSGDILVELGNKLRKVLGFILNDEKEFSKLSLGWECRGREDKSSLKEKCTPNYRYLKVKLLQ